MLGANSSGFAITGNGVSEWIKLDLGGDFNISHLELLNRVVVGNLLNGSTVSVLMQQVTRFTPQRQSQVQ
jgi:hypothetical protein